MLFASMASKENAEIFTLARDHSQRHPGLKSGPISSSFPHQDSEAEVEAENWL